MFWTFHIILMYLHVLFSVNFFVVWCLQGALEKTTVLPTDLKNRIIALKNKYYPIEIDPKLSIEEKCPYMVEW